MKFTDTKWQRQDSKPGNSDTKVCAMRTQLWPDNDFHEDLNGQNDPKLFICIMYYMYYNFLKESPVGTWIEKLGAVLWDYVYFVKESRRNCACISSDHRILLLKTHHIKDLEEAMSVMWRMLVTLQVMIHSAYYKLNGAF